MFAKFFSLKKLSVSQLCSISMLIAITVVLSIASGYLRAGNFGKISLSFISVFVSAAAFGPVIGGFVGAFADIISHFVNPVGAYLWQLTLIEFAYGFIFGIFFFVNPSSKVQKIGMFKIILCIALQFIANMTIKTFVLMSIGYVPSNFVAAFALRFPSCIALATIQLIVLSAFATILPEFLKIIRGKNNN